PRERLDEAWEIVLRNQFHDIIPGSSIKEVYQDSAVEYQEAHALGGGALGEAKATLVSGMNLAEDSLVVFNPTGISRSDLVEVDLPAGTVPVDEEGVPLPVQGKLVYAVDVPANGYRAYPLRQAPGGSGPKGRLTVTPGLIETPHFRIELNERGQISRLLDKVHAREVLAPGQAANVLQAFEDKPMNYDAWDIDIYYTQKCREVINLVEATVEEAGPERGVLKLVWRFEDSAITQRLTVYARTPRLDLETHVDWQQSQVLLKAAFPVQVHSTRATYEIQFGNVERPTHRNTSWDWARFESVGHKWADLSEGGYGVSLLNDCKYGYDIHNNVLRLTLIKSPIWPDPTADRGEHRFTYSIFPHAEDWYRGGTVAQGYRLNNPLTAVVEPAHQGALPPVFSLVSCEAPNVMIETVKRAEAGDGIVVRVYEFGNRRGPAELVFGRSLAAVYATNLLEEEAEAVAFTGRRVTLHMTPYAIRTLKVQFAD
ncbi:MAG TPA: glycoside hydrolase family 38 C-terminal domain-containing protein, partial [Symbiobacteriaceae bacterium]|nr:glycoside hydrolase family 38 C-terminal domain-containing protein [Symbiobacteriaceae bacterium]